MVSTPGGDDAASHQRAALAGASTRIDEAVLTLLVADPEADAYRDLAKFCVECGVTLVECGDGADALFQAGRCFPDVVLLSAHLPVVSAHQVITIIRRHTAVHVAVGISAGEADRAAPALLAGASELVTRPYQVRKLQGLLGSYFARAKERRDQAAVLRLGLLELNPLAHEVRAAGHPLELTLMEFELLRYLLVHAERVVTHEQIRQDVWGARGTEATSNTIAVHIRRIRAQLDGAVDLINIRGLGYRLTAPEIKRQNAQEGLERLGSSGPGLEIRSP